MARMKHFAVGVVSSYLLLGANIVFTLISTRLALGSLGTQRFGAWVLCAEIFMAFQLFDAGISSSLTRLLIQHKDEGTGGRFSELLGAAWLVFLAQGLLVVIVCIGGFHLFPKFFDVPVSLHTEFSNVLILQGVLWLISAVAKPFTVILFASHRGDLVNLTGCIGFGINLGVLSLAFRQSASLYSLIAGQAASLVFVGFAHWVLCRRLCLSRPPARVTRWACSELFRFAAEVFLVNLGSQLIFFTRTMVVTKAMGLEAGAVWAMCNRAFLMVSQVCWRPLDSGLTMLSEMHARGEFGRLQTRFRDLFVGTLCLIVAASSAVTALNGAFVDWWSGGMISWAWHNDLLLGLWLLPVTVSRCGNWFFWIVKDVGAFRYLNLVEGVAFMVLGYFGGRMIGMTGVLSGALLCALSFGAAYTFWRLRIQFRIGWDEYFTEWFRPAVIVAGFVWPAAAGIRCFVSTMPPFAGFVVGGTAMSLVMGTVLFRFALSPKLRNEISARISTRISRSKKLPDDCGE